MCVCVCVCDSDFRLVAHSSVLYMPHLHKNPERNLLFSFFSFIRSGNELDQKRVQVSLGAPLIIIINKKKENLPNCLLCCPG